ncbi:MAG: regulatory iron-sulfur-containing complex subunit RicT [Anaerolineales bacterium]
MTQATTEPQTENRKPTVVGVRFQRLGKAYHFDAGGLGEPLHLGDHVLVTTSHGRQIGQVVQFVSEPVPPAEGTWRRIDGLASAQDLLIEQSWRTKEPEALVGCRERSVQLGLRSVKIVAAQYGFEGQRLTFVFTVEGEEHPELKSLRADMQQRYSRSQVELHQVGPRDVARILGGMGACGLEARCCSKFLTEFSPISIKMAKAQGISLNPGEITGMCGRLRCCLIYEYEQYVQARLQLPKRGKRVATPRGEGKVVDVFPLRESVLVDLGEEAGAIEFSRSDLQPLDELEALQTKADDPCGRQTNAGCARRDQAPSGDEAGSSAAS